MRRRLTTVAVGFALALTAMPTLAQDDARSRQHREESREQWQKVDGVLQAMGLEPGAAVADLGAGDGFFTVRLAKAVGDRGKVYAVDISTDTLRRLRARVANEKLAQVEVIEGTTDDPKLPAGALDAVLIVNAYHEMKAFKEILPKLRSALKPNGRLVIIEPISSGRRDGMRDEQTRNHEIAIDYVRQDARDAGFAQVSMQDPFTTRANGHGEMWMLVLRPAVAETATRGSWTSTKSQDWQAPELRITQDEFRKLAPSDVLVLDVRDDGMFKAGHLPGAVLMTIDEIGTPEGIARLKGEKRAIVAYCS
jgi:predicted methyltransferase